MTLNLKWLIKITSKCAFAWRHNSYWFTASNNVWWPVNEFHSGLRHLWNSLTNHPTCDQKHRYSRMLNIIQYISDRIVKVVSQLSIVQSLLSIRKIYERKISSFTICHTFFECYLKTVLHYIYIKYPDQVNISTPGHWIFDVCWHKGPYYRQLDQTLDPLTRTRVTWRQFSSPHGFWWTPWINILKMRSSGRHSATLSNVFSRYKTNVFLFKFHWSLFPRA